MLIHNKKDTKLYCFSPPVMVATFCIEVFLVIYTLWRYKLTPITRLVVSILSLLAIFQLSEYMICGGFGMSAEVWARIGFIAITLLPPLGIHLAVEISGKKHTSLAVASYMIAVCFVVYFLVITGAVEHKVCGGNYIIFDMPNEVDLLYGLYYYGLLFTGVIFSWFQATRLEDKKKATALKSLAVGYILFLLPTTTVNLIDPKTTGAIPSIMCGFAITLALVLVFWVLPNTTKTNRQ